MRVHTKIYFAETGYKPGDFIESELSGQEAVDLHHILCKGMGGSSDKDRIENIMALTREEHEYYGDKKQFISFLMLKHLAFLDCMGIEFDREWIEDKIEKYSVYA